MAERFKRDTQGRICVNGRIYPPTREAMSEAAENHRASARRIVTETLRSSDCALRIMAVQAACARRRLARMFDEEARHG